MIKIKEAIIVEGKYDKIRLSNVIDGLIITTDGFGLFKNRDKQALIRQLAESRGILVLTDSDGAGFVIRSFLKGCVDPSKIKNAYIPDIFGKEKRKTKPSKEGKIGVEGIDEAILIEAIRRSGASCETTGSNKREAGEITKTDLYVYGLTGTPDSGEKREMLKNELKLPGNISTNSLLEIINCMMTRQDFVQMCTELFSKDSNTDQ